MNGLVLLHDFLVLPARTFTWCNARTSAIAPDPRTALIEWAWSNDHRVIDEPGADSSGPALARDAMRP
jgi:hypothetical protein